MNSIQFQRGHSIICNLKNTQNINENYYFHNILKDKRISIMKKTKNLETIKSIINITLKNKHCMLNTMY